ETPSILTNSSHASSKRTDYSNTTSNKVGRVINSCGICGISTTLRIIGGEQSMPNEFPWMAQLYNNDEFICGGTLIGRSHILTAAHCLLQKRNNLHVILGGYSRKYNELGTVKRTVTQIKKHPHFDPDDSKANDIAVLKLDSSVSFSRQIRPICLPRNDDEFIGKEGTVTGWGRTSINSELSDRLIKLRLPIVGEKECRENWYGTVLPNKTVVCAGYVNGRKDSCIGDSGGPLIANKYGIWHQVGIVSWGASDSCALTYGVYTRVTAFLDWITKNTFGDNCMSSLTTKR
ncbi:hypothetical protein CHUAL_002550, partial [Chamberlinius hualienensis]